MALRCPLVACPVAALRGWRPAAGGPRSSTASAGPARAAPWAAPASSAGTAQRRPRTPLWRGALGSFLLPAGGGGISPRAAGSVGVRPWQHQRFFPSAAGGSFPRAVGSTARAAAVDCTVERAAAADSTESVEAKIREVLEHCVLPVVRDDGGNVELVRFDSESSTAIVRLEGACQGCPQSAVTLQVRIRGALRHYVPEVRHVVAQEPEPDPDADSSSDLTADVVWAHCGELGQQAVQELASEGTPFFSVFAGVPMTPSFIKRVKFVSRLELAGRQPEHIKVSCDDCGKRHSIEDPQDLLRADKGNATGNAAVVLCPACCVVITP